MGRGSFQNGQTLEEYQQRVGINVMTVNRDDKFNIYTFVEGVTHTINKNQEINFKENDRLIILKNTTVNLDGTLRATDDTDGFNRIDVSGELRVNVDGIIELGNIINSGQGINVENGGTFTLLGEVTIGDVVSSQDNKSFGLTIKGTTNVRSKGTIKLDTITGFDLKNWAAGINVVDNGSFALEGSITVDTTKKNAEAIAVIGKDSNFRTYSSGSIDINTVFSYGIYNTGIFVLSTSPKSEIERGRSGTKRMGDINRTDEELKTLKSSTKKKEIPKSKITMNEIVGYGIYNYDGGYFLQNSGSVIEFNNVYGTGILVEGERTEDVLAACELKGFKGDAGTATFGKQASESTFVQSDGNIIINNVENFNIKSPSGAIYLYYILAVLFQQVGFDNIKMSAVASANIFTGISKDIRAVEFLTLEGLKLDSIKNAFGAGLRINNTGNFSQLKGQILINNVNNGFGLYYDNENVDINNISINLNYSNPNNIPLIYSVGILNLGKNGFNHDNLSITAVPVPGAPMGVVVRYSTNWSLVSSIYPVAFSAGRSGARAIGTTWDGVIWSDQKERSYTKQ